MNINIQQCDRISIAKDKTCSVAFFDKDDLGAILAIERRATEFPWSEKNFIDSVTSSHLCVGVKCKEQWVAHGVFSLAADEAELLILAVDPSYQRLGIARYFMAQMEQVLSAFASQLFLEVRESNHVAIEFYDSLGFHCLGERRNYYPVPDSKTRENALIYGKAIFVE